MQNGTVVRITDRGFGFVKPDGADENAKDIFFHANELQNVQFNDLKEGDPVTFEIAEGEKGQNAVNVNRA